jgi:alkanesulfonate monooxygenase SsuD/methylene tetrahydromethanopterin reductase-like flavin-dependent oxidoreductase (luciferase family)
VRAACATAGRDPDSIILSARLLVCCGRTYRELDRRAALGRDVAGLRATALADRPAEVTEAIGHWAGAGASRLYLAALELVAGEVATAVAGI